MSPSAPRVQLGVLLALVSYSIFASSDALMKGVGGHLNVFEIGFFATLFSLVPALFARRPEERLRDTFKFAHPWLMNLYGVLRICTACLCVHAFVTIPLAEAYCLIFLIPIFLTILAVLFLGETVSPGRWALVLLSFVGVLLVVRPGFRELQLGHLSAFVATFFSAIAGTLVRRLSGRERQVSLLLVPTLYTLGFNLVMMLIVGASVPSPTDMVMLVMAGFFGGVGYLLYLAALRIAPASRVAPMQYVQIVWALAYGALFFAEFPDQLALLGLAVVVLSGLANILADSMRQRLTAIRARKAPIAGLAGTES